MWRYKTKCKSEMQSQLWSDFKIILAELWIRLTRKTLLQLAIMSWNLSLGPLMSNFMKIKIWEVVCYWPDPEKFGSFQSVFGPKEGKDDIHFHYKSWSSFRKKELISLIWKNILKKLMIKIYSFANHSFLRICPTFMTKLYDYH